MSCQKRREGDEEFCPRCNLRWDFGNPPPAGAKCLVGNRKSEDMRDGDLRPGPITRDAREPMEIVTNDDPGALTEEQVTIRLGLLLVSPDSCGYTERQAIVRAMQTAIDPDRSEADLYLANNEVLLHFPWLKNIRRRHEGV